MKKLFIITGEHSGDLHASFVVNHLKELNPNIISDLSNRNIVTMTDIQDKACC